MIGCPGQDFAVLFDHPSGDDRLAGNGGGHPFDVVRPGERPPDDHHDVDIAPAVNAFDGSEVGDLDTIDPFEVFLDVLVGDDQAAPALCEVPAGVDQALPLAGNPLFGLFARLRPCAALLALPLARRLGHQRRLADRRPCHLRDPHVRGLDVEIAGELEVWQIVAHEIERQGGVGVDQRQAGERLDDVLVTLHPQPAHGAGLRGAGFEDQAPGGVVAAGNQVFQRPPHRSACGQLPDEAELLDRFLPFLVAGARLHPGLDLALPFQLARDRAGTVLDTRSADRSPASISGARRT